MKDIGEGHFPFFHSQPTTQAGETKSYYKQQTLGMVASRTFLRLTTEDELYHGRLENLLVIDLI